MALTWLPPSGKSKAMLGGHLWFVAGFCGIVVSIRRSGPFGGLSKRLHIPQPQVKPPAEQPELPVLQGKAQHQRGQEWYLILLT